ncbi:methyl-accepting chemotaxis protein [Shewanella marinintestina]|uniref:methyl-accepting chemotaxis protein n=1 Tax=Shewanella marinintestina TaxID=190305 RepID=UPI00200ED3A9|nr:methyl-accepting chemotaxis protein [Shewanella marinintestina]MCL1146551.1 methyl-accepting chemotaxis protein [Shewanella marinintestina]
MKAIGFKQTMTFAIMLLVSCCLLVANWISYQALKQDTIQYVENSSQAMTHYEADAISQWFKRKATAIIAMADQYKRGDIQQYVDFARLGKTSNSLYSVFWGFDDGSSYASVADNAIWRDGVADPSQYDPRPRGWYQLAKANQAPVLTDIYTDMVTKQPVISIVTNLGDGVLSGDIGLEILANTVKDIDFPGAQTTIIDSNGKVLATSSDDLKVGQSLADAGLGLLSRAITSQDSYSGDYIQNKDLKLVFSESISLLADQNWYLFISVDESVAYVGLNQSLRNSMFMSAIMLLISIGLVLAILNWLYRPILNLKEMVIALSHGHADLTRRLPVTREDDLGEIASGINRFVANLQSLLKEVASGSKEIGSSISKLNQQTNENTQVLQKHVLETEQVVTAVEEMSATAMDVANNTSQASNAAVVTSDQVSNTNRIVANTKQTVDRLIQDVEDSETNIAHVAQDAVSITKVLQVIGDIAEQTNLLALNAAIEAARAGEQGRGFAVVADEVRALAARTQVSTTEIEQTLDKLQQGINNAVGAMKQTKLTCEQASEATLDVSDNLEKVVRSIADVNDLNTQIATAAEEQSAVSDEISRNMNAIRDMVVVLDDNGQSTDLETNKLTAANDKLIAVVDKFTIE